MHLARSVVAVLLGSGALLCAASASSWAAPTIVEYRVMHVTAWQPTSPSAEPAGWSYGLDVLVSDDACADDASLAEAMASVTVYDPQGTPHTNDAPSSWWFHGDGTATVSLWIAADPLAPQGTYTIIADASDGGQSTPVVVSLPAGCFATVAPETTSPSPDAIVQEAEPLFEWTPYVPEPDIAGPLNWQWFDITATDGTPLWSVALSQEAESVRYGYDEAGDPVPAPPLLPGQSYTGGLWEVEGWIELASEVPGYYRREAVRFLAFTEDGPPVVSQYRIQHVSLVRSYPWAGPTPSWARTIGVAVWDVRGADHVAGVTALDPAGNPLSPPSRVYADEHTACFCTASEELGLPPAGSYTLVAVRAEGVGSAAVITAPVSHFPDPVPEVTDPAPETTVVGTAPLFAWTRYPGFMCEGDPPGPVTRQRLEVTSPGEATFMWGQDLPLDATSTPYGSGREPAVPLQPAQSYTAHLSEFGPWVALVSDTPGYYMEWTRRDWTFTLAPVFVGFLAPVDHDGTPVFRLGSTVPVRFQLLAADGTQVTDASCRLDVARVTDDIPGANLEATSTDAPDSGSTFRYVGDHYQFNLGTGGLSRGTWRLQVTVNGAVAHEGLISLR